MYGSCENYVLCWQQVPSTNMLYLLHLCCFPERSHRKWEWSHCENTKCLLGGAALNFLPWATTWDILVEWFCLCLEVTTYQTVIKDFNESRALVSLSYFFFSLASYVKSLFLACTLGDVLIFLFAFSCHVLSTISLSTKCHCEAERVFPGDQLETSPRW